MHKLQGTLTLVHGGFCTICIRRRCWSTRDYLHISFAILCVTTRFLDRWNQTCLQHYSGVSSLSSQSSPPWPISWSGSSLPWGHQHSCPPSPTTGGKKRNCNQQSLIALLRQATNAKIMSILVILRLVLGDRITVQTDKLVGTLDGNPR